MERFFNELKPILLKQLELYYPQKDPAAWKYESRIV